MEESEDVSDTRFIVDREISRFVNLKGPFL